MVRDEHIPPGRGSLLLCVALMGLALAPMLSGLSAAAPLSPQGSAELPERYAEWLDFVAYIIEEEERRTFDGLTTDWQREGFIEAFWKRRDPEPVTPENEYRIEYRQRWEYVNDVFGRDTPVPGWRTDRGRVYLVNGPPFQVHPYPNTQQMWPLEIWEYRDTPRPGMPSFYQIIFFKPRVFNEWRLYSPAVDRPEGLVIASPADIDNINLQRLATRYPMVFTAALQAAPGLGRLGSEALIARTMSPPPPPRPMSYATAAAGDARSDFLGAAPLSLYVRAVGFVHPDLAGYADLAIEVPSSETTFVPVEEDLLANYEVEYEIQTENAGTWRRPSEGMVLRVPESDGELVSDLPIEFRKRLWLLPGRYRVRVLLREVATRRVGAGETTVVVPDRAPLIVGPPELFYSTERAAGGEDVPIPWVRRELRRGQSVGCMVRLAVALGDDSPPGLELEYRVLRGGEVVWNDRWRGETPPRSFGAGRAVVRNLRIEQLPIGSYRLEVVVRSDAAGIAPVEKIAGVREFEIVQDFLPVARLMPAETVRPGLAEGHHELGQQRMRRDQFAEARSHFEMAARLDPRNPSYKVDAAKTLILAGELEVADFLLGEALNQAPSDQDALATFGLLRLQTGEPEAAVRAYERALSVAPGTPAIYNGMAEALLVLGKTERALESLELSLEINGDQRQVRDLRDRLAEQRGRQ